MNELKLTDEKYLTLGSLNRRQTQTTLVYICNEDAVFVLAHIFRIISYSARSGTNLINQIYSQIDAPAMQSGDRAICDEIARRKQHRIVQVSIAAMMMEF